MSKLFPGEGLLKDACKHDHHNKASWLIKHGVDPECGRTDVMRRTKDESPLIKASKSGAQRVIETLLKSKVELKQVDWHHDRNALHWACKRGHYGTCIYLVKLGMNQCSLDREKITPLMFAAWWGHTKITKFLLSGPSSKQINRHSEKHGWNALIGAVHHCQLECIKLLLASGADPNELDAYGRPALLHSSDARVAKLLLDAGAVCEMTARGKNILHLASERDDPATVEVVIENIMLKRKDPKILQSMVYELDGVTGRSPIAIAKVKGHKKVLTVLRSTCFHVYSTLSH